MSSKKILFETRPTAVILAWALKKIMKVAEQGLDIAQTKEAIVEAAKSAAFSDPRFRPLEKQELNNIIIEISVLTEPKLIQEKAQELLHSIEIGRDGLIIQFSSFSGLLLPQVPVEQNWDLKTFLKHGCLKAGLPENEWKKRAKIEIFSAQVFRPPLL